MSYTDAIVHCPYGFGAVLMEFHSLGLTQYVEYDEDGSPYALGSDINRLYPVGVDVDVPIIAYLRGKTEDMEALSKVPMTYSHVMAICPAGGGVDTETGDSIDIYSLISEEDEATYRTFYSYPATMLDESGVEIPNPKAGVLKRMPKYQ